MVRTAKLAQLLDLSHCTKPSDIDCPLPAMKNNPFLQRDQEQKAVRRPSAGPPVGGTAESRRAAVEARAKADAEKKKKLADAKVGREEEEGA